MLLNTLATTSAAVGATRSRLAKRALLAETIVAADPGEIELVITYLSGSLRQRRTGVGWASLTSLPDPIDEPGLTVQDVDSAFDTISGLAGSGSATARTAAVGDLFARATPAEQNLLRGLIFDELRQGALDAAVQDGLAAAFGVPLGTVQRASMLLGSTAAAAALLVREGVQGLEQVTLQVGQPIRPMLAASAPAPEGAVAKTALPALVDVKLDGIRVQIHRNGAQISIYTRSLDDITDRLPEIVEVVAGLNEQVLVLDGEVLGLSAAGRPLPFQVVASRTGSSVNVEAARRLTPLTLFVFDLLRVGDRDLLDQPLTERVHVMAATLPAGLLVPRRVANTEEEVTQVFADAVAAGYEGVVVKKLNAPYAAGRRDSGWVKLKPRHTFDLAVIAAEWGHGRRQGWLSNLHLAARDPRTGELVMLGKTFKGLTDEILAWQTTEMLSRESRRTRGTVYLEPPLVAEIAFDGIQKSPRYPGGVALRFARVLRYRNDKTSAEVDTIDAVVALGAVDDGDA